METQKHIYLVSTRAHSPNLYHYGLPHGFVGANKVTSLWVKSIRTPAYANLDPQRVSSYLELHSLLDKVYEIEIKYGIQGVVNLLQRGMWKNMWYPRGGLFIPRTKWCDCKKGYCLRHYQHTSSIHMGEVYVFLQTRAHPPQDKQ